MFLGVQDPNQGQGLSGLVAPEKPSFCCNRVPFSSKNHGFVATGYHFPRKTMVLLQQGTIFLEKPSCIIFSGEGSRVEGLRFVVVRIWILSSEKKKITNWNLPKTIGKTIEKQWFLVMKMWKVNRSRVAPQPSLALARAKSPLRGAGGYYELVAIVACRRPGKLFAETPKNRVFGI